MTTRARSTAWLLAATLGAALGGCATTAPPVDYTAYRQHMPKSVLVLPPTSQSPDIKASNGMLSHATQPLAESGYYVIPVTLVAETLKQNGVQTPAEAHALPARKLQQIFGADAVLYLNVTQYGTQFQLLDSVTTVAATGKLVDLATGQLLWEGRAQAQDGGGRNQGGGGLAALMVAAVVNQIVGTASDRSFRVAALTSSTLLRAGRHRGLLWGPRAPEFGKDGAQP